MRLDVLIEGCPLRMLAGDPATHIAAVVDDSRQVAAGSLFYLRPSPAGEVNLEHARAALAAGAAAVLWPALPDAAEQVPGAAHLVVEGVADQAIGGHLANRLLGDPAGRLKLLAVTGTNGKTTVATLVQQLLEVRGVRCGLLGTVTVDTRGPDGPQAAQLTTPGAMDLARSLAQMVQHGCTACVLEASSHAIDQGRTGFLPLTAAAFTNLTGDHLDYHGTMEAYARAKGGLFRQLDADALAVLNAEDDWSGHVTLDCRAQRLACGLVGETDCVAHPLKATPAGVQARWTLPGRAPFEAFLPLVGAHNVMNALQAVVLAERVQPAVDEAALAAQIGQLKAAPGRLESVGAHWPPPPTSPPTSPPSSPPASPPTLDSGLPTVLVDYAHTHDALARVLEALRPLVPEGGRLITVFGCGGDRDRTKRPKMAAAACTGSDAVILTSDNPRTEDPQAILADVVAGVPVGFDACVVEADRASAIAAAIGQAGALDTVLIAGKGHEDYQILGTEKVHFDDREQAARALRTRMMNDEV